MDAGLGADWEGRSAFTERNMLKGVATEFHYHTLHLALQCGH
jgi:hypothetical protein